MPNCGLCQFLRQSIYLRLHQLNLTLMNLMKFIKMIHDCSLGRLLPILIGQRRINPRLNYLGRIRTRNACQPLQEVWN